MTQATVGLGEYLFRKFNENHDEKGRFASADSSGVSTDYRGGHQAPTRADGFGSPATDVNEMMPKFYDHPEWYTTGMPEADKQSVAAIMSMRDNPNAQVTIYRAVPAGVSTINQGDWVTLSHSYADTHAAGNIQGKATILSQTVPASSLWFDGNSINEFGYDPAGAKAITKALFRKYNPNHDEKGRFSSGDGISGAEASNLVNQALQGGFSYNPTTHAEPTSGYMVARVGATVDVPAGSKEEAAKGLAQFVKDNKAMFAAEPDLHIGGWVDNGRLYIEPSDNISSVYHATQLGGARDQIAIWDVKNGQEINTGGTGGDKAKAGSNDPNFGKALRKGASELGDNDGRGDRPMGRGLSDALWDVLGFNTSESHNKGQTQ